MTQVIEGVAFSANTFYDSINFLTISGKMMKIQGGLKWMSLTRNRPEIRLRIRMRSKAKRMNPFTFLGVLVHVPSVGTHDQHHVAADTTNISHVNVGITTRYNEWNQDFNFKKV